MAQDGIPLGCFSFCLGFARVSKSADSVSLLLSSIKDDLNLDERKLDVVSLAIMVFFSYNVESATQNLNDCPNEKFQIIWSWSKEQLASEPSLVSFIDDFSYKFLEVANG